MNARITDVIEKMRAETRKGNAGTMNLHGCTLDDAASKFVSDAIRTSLINLCYISSTHISGQSLDYFISSLANQTRLTSFAIWANPRAKRSTVSALHLSQCLPSLKQLFVDVSDENVDEVCELLAKNKTLRQFIVCTFLSVDELLLC